MQSVINFMIEQKAFLAALLGLILSEGMALNPKWKASGILQWIGQQLKKLAPPAEGPKA